MGINVGKGGGIEIRPKIDGKGGGSKYGGAWGKTFAFYYMFLSELGGGGGGGGGSIV